MRTPASSASLVPQFLQAVHELREAILPPLVTLGNTLGEWAEEIGRMWRFPRNNGITEGFRKFHDYRTRVKVLCA